MCIQAEPDASVADDMKGRLNKSIWKHLTFFISFRVVLWCHTFFVFLPGQAICELWLQNCEHIRCKRCILVPPRPPIERESCLDSQDVSSTAENIKLGCDAFLCFIILQFRRFKRNLREKNENKMQNKDIQIINYEVMIICISWIIEELDSFSCKKN